MKAVICTKYGSPDVLQVRDVEKPIPGDKEILIRVFATTVTSGDARIRSLNVPAGFKLLTRIVFGFSKPRKPILGVELAGEVEAIGTDVTQFNVGDQIFGASGNFGCNAEYVVVPEKEAIAIIPSGMSHQEAAAVPFGALSSLVYLRDLGKIQAGQRVLINGASGALGTYAVQLAKYFGTEVTGVCSSANLELVKSLGADRVVDYTREDFTENGETYDIIFDTVGKLSFSRCKDSLNHNGRFLLAVAGVPQFLQVLWTSLIGSKKAVAGVAVFTKEDLVIVKGLIEEEKIRAVIDRRYGLEQTADAHRYVDKGHKKGNVVITVQDEKQQRVRVR